MTVNVKYFIILPVICLGLGSLSLELTSVSAQTPTATDTGSLRDSVKQKVTQELSQIKNAIARKAFVGNITSKSDATITINTLLNQSRTALVSTDTTIKLKSGADGTPSDITVGDYVIAMGDVDSQNTMTTKRLIEIPKPASDKRQVVFGTVTARTTSTLTIQTSKKQTQIVKLSAATKYTGKTKAADIVIGNKVVVIGPLAVDSSLTALRLHLLSQ